MPHVLFNDLILLRQRSGVGGYAAALLHELRRLEDVDVIRLTDTWVGGPLKYFFRRYSKAGTSRSGAPSPASRLKARVRDVAERMGYSPLGALLGRGNFSLYHEPDAIPLPMRLPTVTTFHDLSVLRFPQWHPAHRVRKYERHVREGISRTRRFIAVSSATRDEMVEFLGIDGKKIDVIPEAPRSHFHPVSSEIVGATLSRYEMGSQYLLFVGTLEPRKNVAGLLRSYASLPDAFRARCPLVLAGAWGWHSDEARDLLERPALRGSVRVLGYVPDEDLVPLVAGARALVYPSFYEGFGLPPLEAMACATPVITSAVGALKETVGDAAITVDPEDEAQIAKAMLEIVDNRDLAVQMRQRGMDHVKSFSWRRAAELTRETYRKALE